MSSVMKWIDKYVSFDLETTGYDREIDSVIECAAIRYENGVEKERFQSLVRPPFPVDQFITELTGITNDMLKDAPSFRSVLPELLRFICGDTLLGHNLAFDLGFMRQAGANVTNEYIDTMRLSRRIWPQEAHHRLRDLNMRLLGGKNESVHRSAEDAEMTAKAYEAMKRYCRENGINIAFTPTSHGHKQHLRAADVTSSATEFNADSLVYGRVFVFTGTLSLCQRRDAMQMVVDCGGICGDNVTAKTNYLVLGTQDYKKVGDSGKSSKQRKAEKLQLEGQDIATISENVFISMIQEARL